MPTFPSPMLSLVQDRSVRIVGDALVGIVVFGSWARGEATPGSDLDLLIVVDDRIPLTRALYRRWDEWEPLQVNGSPIEPHFMHMPRADGRLRSRVGPKVAPSDDSGAVSSLWAEAAVDGLVLRDTGTKISRILAAIVSRIASGELVARRAHGHRYWLAGAAP